MKKGFITWHFSVFWNAFYIFKQGLCFLGFIGFSYPLNILAFCLCGVHFGNKLMERVRALISCLTSLALLYHDSFLPGIEQMMAQRDNITQFSLSYVLEFIAGFVNVRMLIAIPVCFLLMYFVSRVIRGCTLVFMGFMVLFGVEGSDFQRLTSQQDGVIASERFLKDRSLDVDGMLAQRGSFTRSNLSSYEKQFYENEALRTVSFAASPVNAFSIVFITADGLSNDDLSTLNAHSHAVLQRFDLHLDNFNAVSVSEPELSARLFSSICGQRHSDSYANEQSLNEKCSLPMTLARAGLSSVVLFDDAGKSTEFKKTAAGFGIDPGAVQAISGEDSTRAMFDLSLDLLRDQSSRAIFMRFSQSLQNSNKAVAMAAFLANLNIFLDRLEYTGIRSLIVLMPGTGGSSSDITLRSFQNIPSDKRCLGSVFFRLSSLPHANEIYHVRENVSYLAVAEVISRIISMDPYAEDALISAQSLTDELPRTAFVGEDHGARFMLFRNRRFSVAEADSDAWISFEK